MLWFNRIEENNYTAFLDKEIHLTESLKGLKDLGLKKNRFCCYFIYLFKVNANMY